MRKLLVMLLVLAASGSAHAASSGRVVEEDYTFIEFRYGTSPIEAYFAGVYEFEFKPQPGERWVSISIEDLVVSGVPAVVHQPYEFTEPFCGSTSKPVRIVPHKRVIVRVGRGTCEPPNVWGTGTHVAGTITATFTR